MSAGTFDLNLSLKLSQTTQLRELPASSRSFRHRLSTRSAYALYYDSAFEFLIGMSFFSDLAWSFPSLRGYKFTHQHRPIPLIHSAFLKRSERLLTLFKLRQNGEFCSKFYFGLLILSLI